VRRIKGTGEFTLLEQAFVITLVGAFVRGRKTGTFFTQDWISKICRVDKRALFLQKIPISARLPTILAKVH